MEKKELPCLKKFGFLPNRGSSQYVKVGRRASERHYLEEEGGIYLTTREFQICTWLARGCTVREAAERLRLSCRTGEFYLANIRRKLGVRNKQELLQRLFDNNFFQDL